MATFSEIFQFLQNYSGTGSFTSYENLIENKQGHVSSFFVGTVATNDLLSLSIKFLNPEDTAKHLFYLEK